jgi:uncharacterized protein YgiM (DUF1202 family)
MIARHTILRTISSRLIISAAASVVIGSSLLTSNSFAAPAPEATVVGTADKAFIGVLNDDNVYVRSGPSDVYYATVKLSRGAKVTVVGQKNDWLKILPPEGSYSYVAKAYVEKSGDGSVGRVTKADLNVRAGSQLNGLKTTVQTSLQQGEDVKIVGEQDEYFKITPPGGAFLYVKASFVDAAPQEAPPVVPVVAVGKVHDPISSDPIPAGGVVPPDATPTTRPAVAAAPAPVPAPVAATPAPVAPPVVVAQQSVTPTTQPLAAAVPAPATQPVEPTAEAKFDAAETAFADSTTLPLDQQPVDSLLKNYTALSTDPALPESMRKIVEMRISNLKLRSDMRKQYVDALRQATEAKARQQSLKAEQEELAQRVKDQQVMMFTALGTLRTSSLQQVGSTMYRLTDPNTGRTLVYLRSNDPKYAGLLNQFIGVRGDITEDSNVSLRVINPTDSEAVDQTKVNNTVSATLIPPSLIPKTATASIGN